MAAEITEKFGSYLRQNLDSLSLTGMIPFQKELEHTMTYTDIEMVRFENIDVEYDIRETDFSVPPLCLQPIVEKRDPSRSQDPGTGPDPGFDGSKRRIL